MKHFLSSAQVADYLGISRDALNAKIRAGDFAEPEVLIGDRFQGWSPETIERVRAERDGNRILCDPAAAGTEITIIRELAELVRAYGDIDGQPGTGIHLTVPAAMLAAAGRLENEVRTLLVLDHSCARAIAKGFDPDPALYEVTALPLPTFRTVDSIIRSADTDDVTRITHLQHVVADLAAVMDRMPNVLRSAGTRLAVQALGTERDKIAAHIDRLSAGVLAKREIKPYCF